MLDLWLKLNPSFTEADREACLPLVIKMVGLAETARKKGLQELEAEAERDPSYFLRLGMHLIVEGTDPNLVTQVLQALIISGGYSGAELLSRLMIADGILMIQKGRHFQFILIKLAAMLGEGYIQPLLDKWQQRP